MSDQDDLEALASLRMHPGWAVFVTQLQEARQLLVDNALYEVNTIEQLWYKKGWLECADRMLDAPNEARATIGDEDDRSEPNEPVYGYSSGRSGP
jgi:hypothetical protein